MKHHGQRDANRERANSKWGSHEESQDHNTHMVSSAAAAENAILQRASNMTDN